MGQFSEISWVGWTQGLQLTTLRVGRLCVIGRVSLEDFFGILESVIITDVIYETIFIYLPVT